MAGHVISRDAASSSTTCISCASIISMISMTDAVGPQPVAQERNHSGWSSIRNRGAHDSLRVALNAQACQRGDGRDTRRQHANLVVPHIERLERARCSQRQRQRRQLI